MFSRFYNLVDQCIISMFKRCQTAGWQSEFTASFLECLRTGPLSSERVHNIGLGLHIVENFLSLINQVVDDMEVCASRSLVHLKHPC